MSLKNNPDKVDVSGRFWSTVGLKEFLSMLGIKSAYADNVDVSPFVRRSIRNYAVRRTQSNK